MALRLAKETPQKVVGDYWRVIRLDIRPLEQSAQIDLGLYVDEMIAKGEERADIMQLLSFKITSPYFSESGLSEVSPMITAYKEIKRQKDFIDAEDA